MHKVRVASKVIKLREIKNTCTACPSQWEGLTIKGQKFYARYRWGVLRIDINNKTVLHLDLGDCLDGSMDEDQLFMLAHIELVH